MSTKQRSIHLGIVAILALVPLLLLLVSCQQPTQEMGVTNLDSLHLSDTGGTATPALLVNQAGSGRIVEVQDATTPVWSVNDGGTVEQTGAMDFGGALNVDGNISSSVGSITMTDGVYITGTLDTDGATAFNSTLDVDGNVSSGTGAFTVTDSLNVTDTVDLDSSLNVDGATTLNSTLDVDGNVSSGTGALTVTDSLNVTGTVDFDSSLNVDGDTTLNGTLDVDGNISSGTGAITATDNVYITGTLDVDGATTLNSTLDVDGAISSGTGAITMTDASGVAITTGGLDIQAGNLTLANDETIDNSVDGIVTVTVASGGFFNVATGNLKVGNGSPSLTLNGEDAYVEGTFEADGGGRFDASVTVAVGDLTISNGQIFPGFSDLEMSDGETLTPTVDVYAIDSTGNITITIAACDTDGENLTLIADDANNIVINNTNLRTTDGGAITINQYDVVKFVCQDTEWLHMLESNNQ